MDRIRSCEDPNNSRSVLVSGLAGPWELTWGPDGMLWVTERTGKRVTRIDPANGKRRWPITITEESRPAVRTDCWVWRSPELLKGTGKDYVYLAYTYVMSRSAPHPDVHDPAVRIATFI